ncbi:CvpA family protein [Campylobacter sp. RM16192]|uniref:CvpA family protein n=1 Tax=Campylobacter sp. RM16192 TaxID=1660080 RepID=UPI0014527FA2|nr:CvpA family protein [Campylobacter sp. RM16192]QCD53064.1 putative membrane protein, CvpA family [Campylobacter sp. RM16192]
MDFVTVFDISILAAVLILGIKGIMSGLIREVFGLIGLIGGIVVASRFASHAGKIISDNIYKIESDSILFFAGFLSILIIFWMICVGIGMFLAKLAGLSGLGFLDRVGGFLMGSLKIFLIFSVLVVTISNINALNNKIEPYFKDSKLYPILLSAGKWIMNIDVNSVKKSIEERIQTPTDKMKNNMIQIEDNTTMKNNNIKVEENSTVQSSVIIKDSNNIRKE